MAGNWGDFLPQLGQQAAGGILGLALGGASNKQQFKQQTKLGHLQLGLNKLQTDYNMKKQLEMWEATNYSAQMEQLRKAGLNPALLYGMSGGGGATTNVETGNMTGGQAMNHAGTAASVGATMAQLGLMRAQKENIEADTANKKADIPIKGATVPKLEAETASLLQGIKNQKAQQELTEIQSGIAGVEEYIALQTQNQVIAKIGTELRYLTAQMHIWERNNKVDAQTADEKIRLLEMEVVGKGLEQALVKAQTGKTEEEIKKIVEETKAIIQSVTNETNRVAIDQQIANFETSFGKQVGGVIGAVLNLLPFNKGEKTPRGTKPPSVSGFRPRG